MFPSASFLKKQSVVGRILTIEKQFGTYLISKPITESIISEPGRSDCRCGCCSQRRKCIPKIVEGEKTCTDEKGTTKGKISMLLPSRISPIMKVLIITVVS